MSVSALQVDAVVVGAGTAGANVAGQLARHGLSVALIERRAFGKGGAHWHNGVPPWQFDRAGVARPEPPEKVADGGTLHLFGPDGTHAVTIDNPVWSVDMALLGDRLRNDARSAGVHVFDQADSLAVETNGDRVTAVSFHGCREGSNVAHHRLEASLFVDAAGWRGALRRTSPILSRWCAQVRGPQLCSAGDHQLRVADQNGAQAFLERHGAKPGDGVTVVGCDGGFSTRAIRVSEDVSHVSVLVGCLADGRSSSAPRMIAATRNAEPWLGKATVTGQGVIPLRRPYARLVAPGIALVGDAGCQVFPGHGSGIGTGMIAGTMLAESVADASDPGDETVLWRYQAAFHREFGGLLASYDAVRQMSTALGTQGVNAMVHAKLLNPTLSRAGLDQREATPALRDLPAMVASLARRPRLAATVLPWLARGRAASMWATQFPHEVDAAQLARWEKRMSRLLGG